MAAVLPLGTSQPLSLALALSLTHPCTYTHTPPNPKPQPSMSFDALQPPSQARYVLEKTPKCATKQLLVVPFDMEIFKTAANKLWRLTSASCQISTLILFNFFLSMPCSICNPAPSKNGKPSHKQPQQTPSFILFCLFPSISILGDLDREKQGGKTQLQQNQNAF